MFRHLYVVLEDGGIDLKQFFLQQTGPLHIDLIRHISRQICAAVAYLHSCRVVHRDLKPANILIDPNPQSPTYLHVRIADFGASRSVELPLGTDIPPPCLASSPPSPRAIRKSKSEANFLASAADSEFRTVAGEDGMHACLEMGMEHMSINDDFQTNGSGPM
jgi:serine/threonine protein kinase